MTLKALASLALFFTAISSHALTVISDLDDTIKISRVKRAETIYNGLFSTDVFLGTPALLQNLRQDDPNHKLFLVSGSPRIVKYQVTKLLVVNKIQVEGMSLLNGTNDKPVKLEQLVRATNDDIILLGDDQEKDPLYYSQLQANFPDQIKAVYIHQVNTRTLPEGQIGYLTAYEVAAHEVAAGRLSQEQLQAVEDSIVQSLDFNTDDIYISKRISKLLIPSWQKCNRKSVTRVLATTRALPFANRDFLNRVEKIALDNCQD